VPTAVVPAAFGTTAVVPPAFVPPAFGTPAVVLADLVVAASTPAATPAGGAAARMLAIAIRPARVRAVAIPLAMLHTLFEALETVQDLFEFLFDAATSASIGLRPHTHALRERGADEDEDGNGCDTSHKAFVTRDYTRMFRPGGSFPIIGRVKRIDHVGIAVPDLTEARRTWDLVLGQEPKTDEVGTQKVMAAMYPCGIELIAPTADDSPISKFLAKRGSGIHHVTVEVEDIEAHLARLMAAGVRLINETPTPGHGGCRVAFLHPAATGGVLVELKESK